ncbi:hypothetical protein FPRO06_13014 [Fusarium proliferatum]|nr:hypothetical protein FPRO06_13014 [Fusarium proliferatum]CVL11707.1 uncharacterized protein FPRN_14917 [Fusarium proliferatum]
MSTDQNVLIPIKLDAFILNNTVCDGGHGKAKIAPITQPNYTFLRLDKSWLQPDISYNVDLHSVSGAKVNSRITDLGTGNPRENRRGVYLHWTIPRIYRSGVTDAEKKNAESGALPDYPEAPSRWLVVRHIEDMSKVEPAAARSAMEPLAAWVVESDRCRAIDGPRNGKGEHNEPLNILPGDTDLQVDVAPFVDATSKNVEGSILEKQAEIFIGEKISASNWTETAIEGQDDTKKRVGLRLMGSSNELFPDFQPHCSNVFSIVDNFYFGEDKVTKAALYATSVQASYYVIGWNSKASADIFGLRSKGRQARFNELNMKIKGFQNEADPMKAYPREIFDWFNFPNGDKEVMTRSVCHGAMYGVSWDLNLAPKNILADKFAKVLAETQPVAIGTTPMDAIMAYAGAHEGIKGEEKGRIEAALKRLEAILLSRDDGVEAHMQATDMLYNWNYSRFDGGDCFFAAASGDQTKIEPGQDPDAKKKETLKLSPEKQATLSKLNRLSRLRDAAKRRLKEQQWSAFSLWWQVVTKAKNNADAKSPLKQIATVVSTLEKCIKDSQDEITRLLGGVKTSDALPPTPPNEPTKNQVKDFEPGVLDPFKQQRDPTLLVGGIQSGWEVDYLLRLLVRLDCQVVPAAVDDSPSLKAFFDQFVDKKMPDFMRTTVKELLREFMTLKDRRQAKDDGHPAQPSMLQEQGLMNPADFKPFGDDWHLYINSEPERPDVKSEIPLYHDKLGRSYNKIYKKDGPVDKVTNEGVWRDLWNDTQPWFPLFLEWEVEYYHIKHDDWDLTKSRWWVNEGAKLHYNIRDGTDLAKKYHETKDRRAFSGRVLILPQPSFTLETKVTQLLTDTLPSELDKMLGEEEREYLVKNLNKLQFLSSPLSGFNSHLQTVDQGNHVKPSLRDPNDGSIIFIKEAERVDAGFDKNAMKLMDLETDVTPYGGMKKPVDGENGPSSFKPVTHGQFKLTKVNVIDKFGQVINLLDPRPIPYNPKPEDIPRAWPCLSDWYSPGAKPSHNNGDGKPVPNTVEEAPISNDAKHEAQCEFAQVPPQINQPARLNASWVIPSQTAKKNIANHSPPLEFESKAGPTPPPSSPFWRAASEWDSPIWGWVVVNYANYGLQFFLPSGAFYREVRAGGPDGAMTSPDWLPFAEPDKPSERGGAEDGGPMAKQLARLIETIASNRGYLKAFIAMVNTATASTGTSAPSAYSEFKSALIGKPLALVNMGFSLELSQPALTSQLLKDGKGEKKLYKDLATRKTPGPGCEKNDVYDSQYYRFPVQLGDGERGFDGLVCYFKPKMSDLQIGDALDLGMMYTHFGPDYKYFQAELAKVTPSSEINIAGSGDVDDPYKYVTTIGRDNHPKLPPYYIDPVVDPQMGISINAQDYEYLTNGQLAAFGAIIDPFSAVHAYSGVLPVKELFLPDWTWQGPIQQISAFFHAGPVLVTWDVPKFDPENKLTQGKLVPKVVDKKKGEHGVALPGGSLGQWTWLQPYMEDSKGGKSAGQVEALEVGDGVPIGEPLEKFMPVAVDLVDDMAHLERGPYTALEGYLQMASGAVQEKQ